MKLSFQKDSLLNGINIVSKAVPSKTTMSILECILIDATSHEIKLTGNDMELGIETKVEGMILEHGKIALDAKLFSDIIRKLSGEDNMITIESDEKLNTIITCDKSVFKIQGRDGEEFSCGRSTRRAEPQRLISICRRISACAPASLRR